MSILLTIFLFGAGCLLIYRHRFPNVVFANVEIDTAWSIFFQVAEGAGMATRK